MPLRLLRLFPAYLGHLCGLPGIRSVIIDHLSLIQLVVRPLLTETAISKVRVVIVRGLIEVLILPLPVLLDDVHRRQVIYNSLARWGFFEVPKTHVMDPHLKGIGTKHTIHQEVAQTEENH